MRRCQLRGRADGVRLPVLPVGTVALVFVVLLVFDGLTGWAEEARNRW